MYVVSWIYFRGKEPVRVYVVSWIYFRGKEPVHVYVVSCKEFCDFLFYIYIYIYIYWNTNKKLTCIHFFDLYLCCTDRYTYRHIFLPSMGTHCQKFANTYACTSHGRIKCEPLSVCASACACVTVSLYVCVWERENCQCVCSSTRKTFIRCKYHSPNAWPVIRLPLVLMQAVHKIQTIHRFQQKVFNPHTSIRWKQLHGWEKRQQQAQ